MLRQSFGRISQRCSSQQRHVQTHVFALGEGWTGALGSGRLDDSIRGHHDYEDIYDENDPIYPLLVYSTPDTIHACAVGWGHTALIVGANDESPSLLLTGRPHEVSALLRLQRLPAWFRRHAVAVTYRSAVTAHVTRNIDPTDIIGRVVTFLSDIFLSGTPTDWEAARQQSSMITWTPVEDLFPEQISEVMECGAGSTAIIGKTTGALYMFGLNGMGQCGIGTTSNNVWTPTAVTGLSRKVESTSTGTERVKVKQSHPIQSVALGFQHGLCLNTEGELFSWGKGSRGQLGHDRVEAEAHTAYPITKAIVETHPKPVYASLGRISQITSGMIHSAALEEETNHVYVWGKNILPHPSSSEGNTSKSTIALDARFPVRLHGLPEQCAVIQVACGSHHTSVLLDDGSVWAVGVATDTQLPVHNPVCLIAPGVLNVDDIVQFDAHMDRTTVVTGCKNENQRQEVYQVQLWAEPENQTLALFTPEWVDGLLTQHPNLKIREVHRSWLHTIIVAEENEG